MLDKRKVSVLTTCQSAISKEVGFVPFESLYIDLLMILPCIAVPELLVQIDSYRKDAADIHMLLSHLVYISNTIASVREATSRADPDIILHSFVGLPGALTSRLLHEGQNSAYQLKYFEWVLYYMNSLPPKLYAHPVSQCILLTHLFTRPLMN